jgi:hypothetical protein
MGLDIVRALLEKLDKSPPPKTPRERRIDYLESALNNPSYAYNIPNISAVLDAYRTGSIEYKPNYFYVFKDGECVVGPLPDTSLYDVQFEQFREVKGRWIERVSLF